MSNQKGAPLPTRYERQQKALAEMQGIADQLNAAETGGRLFVAKRAYKGIAMRVEIKRELIPSWAGASEVEATDQDKK